MHSYSVLPAASGPEILLHFVRNKEQYARRTFVLYQENVRSFSILSLNCTIISHWYDQFTTLDYYIPLTNRARGPY